MKRNKRRHCMLSILINVQCWRFSSPHSRINGSSNNQSWTFDMLRFPVRQCSLFPIDWNIFFFIGQHYEWRQSDKTELHPMNLGGVRQLPINQIPYLYVFASKFLCVCHFTCQLRSVDKGHNCPHKHCISINRFRMALNWNHTKYFHIDSLIEMCTAIN